ncbi:MAG: GC-type dockerin domain-anchored protein [Phycisphaerales bacterium]
MSLLFAFCAVVSVSIVFPLATNPVMAQDLSEDDSVYPTRLTMLPGNSFGRTIAIDDGLLAVGAFFRDFDKSNNDYGSAYLFDVSSGVQVRQLIANDWEPNNSFGRSIDIHDGIAVVGAKGPDDLTGSVYVFDVTTGIQLHKLIPEDLDTRGDFGFSVAIDNGVIAVGAPISGFFNIDESGYVYLFDALSGDQLHKVSPNEEEFGSGFGFSVDMDSGRLAVGAPMLHNPEQNTGSLYVFSVNGGVQLRKFSPESLEFGDHLGWSVASSGTRIAVGAPANGNNVDGVSAVYIYDALSHTEVSRITPDPVDATQYAGFGQSVAFENDIVVVGAEKYDGFAGLAFVFNATTGLQAVELQSDDREEDDQFGSAVAIEGFDVVVGARHDEHGGLHDGSAYVFSTFTGSQTDKLLPDPEDRAYDLFGYAVAASTNLVAVTANGNDTVGIDAGAAYLYDATDGDLLTTYYPDTGTNHGNFGYSIDYDSAVVVVGATGDDENGTNHGAAYVYWALNGDRIRKLVPSDGAAGDFFGASVALDVGFNGGLVAVGSSFDDDMGSASGSVYLYNPFSGAFIDKLYADDAAAGNSFGNSIDIDEGIMVVGAYRENGLGFRSGAAYLFDLQTRTQIAKLVADDGMSGDLFGWSVSIDDGVVAVGAWGNDAAGLDSGAVYLFDAMTGAQLAKFVPDDAEADDRFGYSVSIDRGVVLAGSYHDSVNGEDSGSAYIFGASSFEQLYKLVPSDGDSGNMFGRSVAVSNRTIGVGSIGDGVFGPQSGSAQIFTVPADICPADLTGDRVLDFFDISAFLVAYSNLDMDADLNGDGVFDFFDISAFLVAFNAGCP